MVRVGRRGAVHRRAALVAAVTALLALPGCTGGPGERLPPTPDGPYLTPVTQARALPRLDPPARTPEEVSRLTVRAGDDGSFAGRSLPVGATTADGRYRLTGRCLADGGEGVFVVDVMGPVRGGADGAPSEPLLGDAVASAEFRCDGAVTHVDLPSLPVGSAEVMPSPRTESVAVGWVVLSRIP